VIPSDTLGENEEAVPDDSDTSVANDAGEPSNVRKPLAQRLAKERRAAPEKDVDDSKGLEGASVPGRNVRLKNQNEAPESEGLLNVDDGSADSILLPVE
jgi:hypothetical protein